MALVITGAEFTARHARNSPQGLMRAQLHDLPPFGEAQSDEAWAVAVRRAVAPGERMLAVPFAPELYLRAGRLPMNRYVYYLPWDADYALHPWLGLQHDLCADIKRDPPPVIYNNGWTVWKRYDPHVYMACLWPILAAQYRPIPGAPFFYVRADRLGRIDPKKTAGDPSLPVPRSTVSRNDARPISKASQP